MEERKCVLCGSEEGLNEITVEGKKMVVCESCFNDVSDANKEMNGRRNESARIEKTRNEPQKHVSDTGRTKITNKDETLNWTQIFKVVNFILLAIFVIAGTIFGAMLFEGILGSGGFIIGIPVGAVAGTLAGMAIVSFSMVIVEISQKLTAILEELKIANKKK